MNRVWGGGRYASPTGPTRTPGGTEGREGGRRRRSRAPICTASGANPPPRAVSHVHSAGRGAAAFRVHMCVRPLRAQATGGMKGSFVPLAQQSIHGAGVQQGHGTGRRWACTHRQISERRSLQGKSSAHPQKPTYRGPHGSRHATKRLERKPVLSSNRPRIKGHSVIPAPRTTRTR